jgi:hypothetical protein
VVEKVTADHGSTLQRGATLIDPDDHGTEPRLLVYLDHTITDGRLVNGHRQVVSRRFQYVEIRLDGTVTSPGAEPYLGYAPISEQQRALLGDIESSWADHTAEGVARNWAIEHLAAPHLAEIADITRDRVAKVRAAVHDRLIAEIRYWDQRCEEIKQQELAGKKPQINSGRARARADEPES